MEYIFTIVGLLAVQAIFSLIIEAAQNNLDRFKIKSKIDMFSLDGKKDIPIILIEAKGIVPATGSFARFAQLVFDITSEGDPKPVLNFMPEFSTSNGQCLFNKDIELPYEKTIIKSWAPIGIIPLQTCLFPRSGQRKLEIRCFVVDQEGQLKEVVKTQLEFSNEARGYEDNKEYKEKLLELEIRILMELALSDNHFDNAEGRYIKGIVLDFLENCEETERGRLKNKFNIILKDSYEKSKKSSSSTLDCLIKKFNEIGLESDKYKLIKSCTSLMVSDGDIQDSELNIIDYLSKKLNLDYRKVNELKDIYILKGAKSKSSPEALLGINTSWSKHQIQKHLNCEFLKWNSRMANVSDSKERERVQHMLNLISQMRLKYEQKAS